MFLLNDVGEAAAKILLLRTLTFDHLAVFEHALAL